jgi:hypothetical protein
MTALSHQVTVQRAELLISSFLAREAATQLGLLGAERRSVFAEFTYRMPVSYLVC